MFIFSRSEVAPGEFECWGHFAEPWGLKAYVTWMTVAVFLLPALIITICQVTLVELAGISLFGLSTLTADRDYIEQAAVADSQVGGMNEMLLCFHGRCIWQALFNSPWGGCAWCCVVSHGG